MADQKASLDLTHVLYDSDSLVSLALALITLSPILLMASYAVLAVYTRELTVINMWAGQLLCEAFNWLVKRAIKQERPTDSVGTGYGFPSSHSQYMAYFATFLVLHLHFRHRFVSTGYRALDVAWLMVLHVALIGWAAVVAYSRLHLAYHSPAQILWGVTIGFLFGVSWYAVTELIPIRLPDSLIGRLRTFALDHPIAQWVRLRDGWLVWADGGVEEHWQAWASERRRLNHATKPKQT